MNDRFRICNRDGAVQDSLLGFTTFNQDVKLFDFGKVVVRKDYHQMENVRIISGGGSGNEPAYAAFVGKGMLTAAIHGDKYQAPCVDDISRTIRELNYKQIAGVLIISLANSANLLNFGLAMERTTSEKIRVQMVIIADDYNNHSHSNIRKRSQSGIILIFKIAGAMAEEKCSLTEIGKFCDAVAENLCSISVSLKDIFQTYDKCLCHKSAGSERVEIGIGLNQEPAAKRVKIENNKISNLILYEYFKLGNFSQDVESPVVILINNMGGLTQMEEYIFIKDVVSELNEKEIQVIRLYRGSFFTSPTVNGLIFTILKVHDKKVIDYLDAPCSASGWQTVSQYSNLLSAAANNIIPGRLVKVKGKHEITNRGPKLGEKEVQAVLIAIQFICDAVSSCERQLNLIDSELGDGDTGTRLKKVCERILKAKGAKQFSFEYPGVALSYLGRVLDSTVGGSLGCIYGLMLQAAANYFSELEESVMITPEHWHAALVRANDLLQKHGNINLGDGTMYDPLEMFARALANDLQDNPMDAFGQAVHVAETVAEKTKRPDLKFPDSGAHAVGIWTRALYEGIKASFPPTN